MKRLVTAAVFTAVFAVPFTAYADNGSRMAAGGGHMSSYVSDPYHDPRSLHSQHHSTGQILGAPMVSENAGAHSARRARIVEPHWSAGRRAR